MSYVLYKAFQKEQKYNPNSNTIIPMIDVGGIYNTYIKFRNDKVNIIENDIGVLSVHGMKDASLFYEIDEELYDSETKELNSDFAYHSKLELTGKS